MTRRKLAGSLRKKLPEKASDRFHWTGRLGVPRGQAIQVSWVPRRRLGRSQARRIRMPRPGRESEKPEKPEVGGNPGETTTPHRRQQQLQRGRIGCARGSVHKGRFKPGNPVPGLGDPRMIAAKAKLERIVRAFAGIMGKSPSGPGGH